MIANLACQLNVLEERENPNWRTASIRLACCVWGHFPNWQLTDEGLAYCRQCQRCTPGPGLHKKVVEQANKQNSSVALRYLLQAVALIFCVVFLDDGLYPSDEINLSLTDSLLLRMLYHRKKIDWNRDVMNVWM